MKKNIIIAMFGVVVYVSSVLPGYAFYCSNCENVFQGFKQIGGQIVQIGKESVTAASTNVTAIQTTLNNINKYALQPATDAMTLISIAKSGDRIKNLIYGSLGTDALLVDDPLGMIKDTIKDSKTGDLGQVASLLQSSGGLYDDSVLGTLIDNVKYSSGDFSDKIAALGKSPLPDLIANNLCNDSAITDAAYDDIKNSGGVVTDVELAKTKQDIWNYACLENPNSPDQAEKLKKLNAQNSNIGGPDAFLAVTGGANPYTTTIETELLMDKNAEEKADAAKADLAAGRGIKSLTDCTKRASVAPNGEPYSNPDQAPCLKSIVKQAGSVLNTAFTDALGTPLQTAIKSLGVFGIGNLIGSALQTFNAAQGLLGNLGSIASSGNSSSPPVKDLANNAKAKKTISGTPIQQLLAHQTALATLGTTDQSYLGQIAYYQGQVDGMRACYKTLADNYRASTNVTILAGYSYADSLDASNKALKDRIDAEVGLIDSTKNLIQDTISNIQSSQSSEEILDLFNGYQDKVSNQNLPSLTSASQREGEYITFKNDVETSVREDGGLYNYNVACTNLGTTLQAAANTNNGQPGNN